jgi:hypothetical protein
VRRIVAAADLDKSTRNRYDVKNNDTCCYIPCTLGAVESRHFRAPSRALCSARSELKLADNAQDGGVSHAGFDSPAQLTPRSHTRLAVTFTIRTDSPLYPLG